MSNSPPKTISQIYLQTFLSLQLNFNKEISNRVFGDLSNHLFKKWLTCKGNILNFFSILDINNKKKLLNWAEKNYTP